MSGRITFRNGDDHEGHSDDKNIHEGYSLLTRRPAYKSLVLTQMRRHINIPLGIICSELNEVTNQERGKKKSTCNTAELGNYFRKVIQLEL